MNIPGANATRATGRIITANAMDARNTFEQPNALTPAAFNGAQIAGGVLKLTLPAKSVVVLDLE
jgi:alpha-N-arabinofuranosidase